MERAIWNNKEYYAFDIMEDFALETEVRKVSSKELYCPDPCCKKPMLRYCHGDVKDAYFAHLENEECDYGNFDKGTTWSVKKIRRILYEHFKALGYEVQLEQKVLPRHYTHILLTADGKKTAIEIGTQTSIANYIFSVEKQYAERGIMVKWVVISKNDEHRTEADVSYLKRYCFNTSTNNEVLIVDEEGQRFTQIRMDTNKYFYKHFSVDLGNYGELYAERGGLSSLRFENGELNLQGFEQRYAVWLGKKQALFQQKVEYYKQQELKAQQRSYVQTPKPMPKQESIFTYKPTYKEERPVIKETKPVLKETRTTRDWYICYTRAEIEKHIDQQEKMVYDAGDNRWVKCTQCGKVATTGEFSEYGGKGTLNLGVCSECQRKNRKK